MLDHRGVQSEKISRTPRSLDPHRASQKMSNFGSFSISDDRFCVFFLNRFLIRVRGWIFMRFGVVFCINLDVFLDGLVSCVASEKTSILLLFVVL